MTTATAAALPARAQVLVIGSGAGGAATAAILAERGYEVVVLEEGPDLDTNSLTTNSPEAIARLYRNGGVTPVLGVPNIAHVEGRCVGGSTEVNSGFWHRPPDEVYERWARDARLADFSPAGLDPYFQQLERALSVSCLAAPEPPPSSRVFRRGIERLQWRYAEVPRCQSPNDGVSSFVPGNKQSMQRTFLPRARAAGARVVPDCQALRLERDGDRITGVLVERQSASGRERAVIHAGTVFVCCGPLQTAALLRRSGITRNVGDNLCLHPMIKAAALFDEPIRAHASVLPIYQVKEFAPAIAIGGSVCTPGFLAMHLAESWPATAPVLRDWERAAMFYAATCSASRGTVRALPGLRDGVVVRYRITDADRVNISAGLARLGEILFAAGARAVYPSLRAPSLLASVEQCRAFLREPLPAAVMGLSSMHAFSSCPMGENRALCATDSFGKVWGLANLHVNDASLLPDSPGVNPQATVMAVALRNVDRFDDARRSRRPVGPRPTAPPSILVTGAPGWLGTRLVEVLLDGLPGVPALPPPDAGQVIRCLVHPALDPEPLRDRSPRLQTVSADIADPNAATALCADAAGAVLFHLAGVVHPTHGVAELERVNVDGTRYLLDAARRAGVRRVVAVSSNSPFGFNPGPEHVFDERAPYAPYMAYGRSKRRLEELVRAAQATGDLETVIIRPPWFYGPHQPARQTQFFRLIRAGRFPILGDGTQKRSMAHVDNICQGLLLAAATPAANGRAYWIADARPYAINEIVATVRRLLEDEFGLACARRQLRLPAMVATAAGLADGALQALGRYQQALHVLGEMSHTIACSIDAARRDLGYAPTVALEDGMRASIRWCLANGLAL
ncbi:FAD-dependent oxidoreductase [bacterium]|nr:FAD-dependent oxidoreductase [bacterium]